VRGCWSHSYCVRIDLPRSAVWCVSCSCNGARKLLPPVARWPSLWQLAKGVDTQGQNRGAQTSHTAHRETQSRSTHTNDRHGTACCTDARGCKNGDRRVGLGPAQSNVAAAAAAAHSACCAFGASRVSLCCRACVWRGSLWRGICLCLCLYLRRSASLLQCHAARHRLRLIHVHESQPAARHQQTAPQRSASACTGVSAQCSAGAACARSRTCVALRAEVHMLACMLRCICSHVC
jgi:hypothetical protein